MYKVEFKYKNKKNISKRTFKTKSSAKKAIMSVLKMNLKYKHLPKSMKSSNHRIIKVSKGGRL